MKRVAFYRRAGRQDGKHTGLKEKIAWRLSKGQATGRELAELFGMPLTEFNVLIAHHIKWKKTVQIEATEWVKGEDGIRDRTYSLGKPPKYVSPRGKERIFTVKAAEQEARGERAKNIERAERRARLIAAGLYIDELG